MIRGRISAGSTAAAVIVVLMLVQAALASTAGTRGDARARFAGTEFHVSGVGAVGEDYDPVTVWNAAEGEYLVIWLDARKLATRNTDVYSRRIGADGSRLGGDYRISDPAATKGEAAPDLAWNATENEYLAVWVDLRDSTTRGWDIYVRRIGSDGRPFGAAVRVSAPGAIGSERDPAVAWNATHNQYLVVWAEQRPGKEQVIKGQRISAGGKLIGKNFRISANPNLGRTEYPDVAWNATNNQYLVVWEDARNSASRGSDIYGRRLAGNGTLISGTFRISGPGAKARDTHPAVTWNATANGYLVVWADRRHEAIRGSDIFGRRVAANGTRIGKDFRIDGPAATADSWDPAVAWNGADNRYLVVWEDLRDNTTRSYDVYAQHLAANGARIGKDFPVAGAEALQEDYWADLAWNGADNEFLVVWSDARDPVRDDDVYGRILNP